MSFDRVYDRSSWILLWLSSRNFLLKNKSWHSKITQQKSSTIYMYSNGLMLEKLEINILEKENHPSNYNYHTFNNEVYLFVFVLAHVTTKHPASAFSGNGVTAVNGAAPHVANSIGINLCRETKKEIRGWKTQTKMTSSVRTHFWHEQSFSSFAQKEKHSPTAVQYYERKAKLD